MEDRWVKEEELKELEFGWVEALLTFSGQVFLFAFDWRVGLGATLMYMPVAYRADVLRNLLKDYL